MQALANFARVHININLASSFQGYWRKLQNYQISTTERCQKMQLLLVTTILAVTLGEYLTDLLGLPRPFRFMPEILSVIAAGCVIVLGIRKQFNFVAAHYWLVFLILTIIVGFGIFSNGVGPGPTVAGMRYYLRAIPFFLLPAVLDLNERKLRQLLLLLLGIAFLQIPLAIDQRMTVLSQGRFTGDEVVGTLRISSVLSIYLVSVALVLTGFFLKRRIAALPFAGLFLVILIPTMINETKGTLLLLPLGLFATLLVGTPAGRRVRVASWGISLLIVFGAIFMPVYDYMQRNNPYHVPIAEFFTDRDAINRYLTKDAEVGSAKAGRLDAIVVPAEYIARDPVRLAFGLGLGNASHSNLGENFIGEYFPLFSAIAITSGSVFLLEIGLLGTALVYFLYWLILRDALIVARSGEHLMGAVAIGWCGVTAIMVVATFYKSIHTFESLSYLFWLFSGLVAAARVKLAVRGALPNRGESLSQPAADSVVGRKKRHAFNH